MLNRPPLRSSAFLLFTAALLVLAHREVTAACVAPVYRSDTAVVIDGVVDPTWDAVPRRALDEIVNGSGCPAGDMSVGWRASWDGPRGKLVLLVEVTDDTVFTDGSQSWFADNIEVYVDGDNSRIRGSSGEQSGYDGVNDYQLRFLPRPTDNLFIAGPDLPAGAIVAAYELTAEGYRYEIELDLAAFGVSPAETGTTSIGFDLQVSDNDDGWRDHKEGWCSPTDVNWYDPASFGVLELTSSTPPAPQWSLTTAVDGTGAVEATPDKALYFDGEEVTVQAQVPVGYTFSGWSGDLTGTENPVTLSISSDLSVTAHFAEKLEGAFVLGINCGGNRTESPDGEVFEAQQYSADSSMSNGNGRIVTGTDHPELFQTWRWFHDKLIYELPVPNGQYEVDLMWAGHPHHDTSSVFDVAVAGVLVEDDLEVEAAAGGTDVALVRTYPALVTDGVLRIALFRSAAWDPFLNAIAVREAPDPAGNDAPVIHTVNKPGVVGQTVTFCACDFSALFFDLDGDELALVELTALPLHGELWLDGARLAAGDTVARSDLDRLQYRSERTTQGRDLWQWRGSDGQAWSARAAGVNVFLRAGENRVEDLNTVTWNTYSWPLFAFYPEAEGGLVGADGVARHGNACGPTARSQLNYFWKHPRKGLGGLRFRDMNGVLRDTLYEENTYNYHAMPVDVPYDAPPSAYGPVASLMADNDILGVDVWGSGFHAKEPMLPYHGFDGSMRRALRDEMDEATWIETLKHELDRGRVVVLSGFSDTTGHWWIVTGYNESNQFWARLNYGGHEGWVDASDQFGYKYELEALLNFQPRDLGQVLLYEPSGGQWHRDVPNTIRWAAPNATKVDLEYSVDAGLTWQPIARGLDARHRAHPWTPPVGTGNLMVRVTDQADLNAYAETAARPLAEYSGSPLFEAYRTYLGGFPQLTGAAAHAEADADGDGASNLLEFLHRDGNPVLPSDWTVDVSPASGSDRLVCSWPLRAGVDASLLRCMVSASLEPGSWVPVEMVGGVPVQVDASSVEVSFDPADGACFFRFEVIVE